MNQMPGHKLDGVDLLPALKGEGEITERVMHWKYGEAWAVRQGPWKLIS
jgi:hypothetical protein